MAKTKKQKRNNLLLGVVFFIGMAVMAYPLVSRLYYRVESNQQIADFDKEKATLDEADIDERMKLAQAFNDSLNNVVSGDPWSEEMKKKGRAEYARMLEIHERMGHVEIPAIDVDLPVYAGTAEEVLQQGAGHLEGTSLPIGGNSTHAVITAHTGLPTAKMFTDLTKLKVGDKFYVHNIKEVMAYQVDQVKVIEPTNFDDLLIVPGHDYVTLLTCTPYMINTHRLLVRGHRIT
ncbi:PI-1 pilus system sortase SrtC-1, partial [Streptococcus pneumoniae]|uniref:PI-1 pilus system sortase SrtC-1 n=1 Tax=Streptococcus pneumoniae TaxID=1313 RepID=UPI00067C5A25